VPAYVASDALWNIPNVKLFVQLVIGLDWAVVIVIDGKMAATMIILVMNDILMLSSVCTITSRCVHFRLAPIPSERWRKLVELSILLLIVMRKAE
jgi:hypothetical protein